MKCPMKFVVTLTPEVTHYDPDGERAMCEETECAWWAASWSGGGGCSILVLAEKAERATELLERMQD